MFYYLGVTCFGLFCFILVHGKTVNKPKIAIIGGGISGAACAYNLRELFAENADIDVFEPRKVGGRIQVEEIGKRLYEVGASILHESNYYMSHYTKILNLKKRDQVDDTASIFDGESVLFKTSSWKVVTASNLLWRYGLDYSHVTSLLSDLLEKFARIYSQQNAGYAFTSVEKLLTSMTPVFANICQNTTHDYLKSEHISQRFIDEFVSSVVNANYGQTTDVHAFVGLTSLVASLPGIWSVHGGNYQIPEQLLKRSEANILQAEVISITKNTSQLRGSYDLQYMFARDDNADPIFVTQTYDIVILASPLHEGKTDILFDNFEPKINYLPEEYHHIVTTMVQGVPNQAFFMSDSNVILINNPKLKYNLFSRVLPVDWSSSESKDITRKIYKIFSNSRLQDSMLKNMFKSYSDIKFADWLAYPHYTLPTQLPNFILDTNLYYVNGIELVTSAMEMSCIAAKNVALLSYNQWYNLIDKIDQQHSKQSKTVKTEF